MPKKQRKEETTYKMPESGGEKGGLVSTHMEYKMEKIASGEMIYKLNGE